LYCAPLVPPIVTELFGPGTASGRPWKLFLTVARRCWFAYLATTKVAGDDPSAGDIYMGSQRLGVAHALFSRLTLRVSFGSVPGTIAGAIQQARTSSRLGTNVFRRKIGSLN
jgi:hypothetical protein